MRTYLGLVSCLLLIFSLPCFSHPPSFGETYCQQASYYCQIVKQGENWDSLFPNTEIQDLVKRLNRMNTPLKPGIILAVPENVETLTVLDISPFPKLIEPLNEKVIYVSQEKLAWGAYDEQGELLWWGPISSGIGACNEEDNNCATPTGSFRIIRKQDVNCVSTVFPRRYNGEEDGGAPMPYCMHFLRGYALHGSYEVPGYRASHGCIRLFVEDARWLNEEFITLPDKGLAGTRVIIGGTGEF